MNLVNLPQELVFFGLQYSMCFCQQAL